jgi:hypothetical protein
MINECGTTGGMKCLAAETEVLEEKPSQLQLMTTTNRK